MGNIQTPRARLHDARFLAMLDTLQYEGEAHPEYRQERLGYWNQALDPNNEDSKTVFVAREGGMYLGYIMLNDLAYDLRLGPGARDQISVSKALLDRAGVVFQENPAPPAMSDGLAVA